MKMKRAGINIIQPPSKDARDRAPYQTEPGRPNIRIHLMFWVYFKHALSCPNSVPIMRVRSILGMLEYSSPTPPISDGT